MSQNIITCGMVSLRLQMLDARDAERNESIGGSGLPHNEDAHDVDDRNDTESDRFRCGDIWTCFNIFIGKQNREEIIELNRDE